LPRKNFDGSALSCEKSSPLLSEISPYPPLSVKEGERIVAKHHPPLYYRKYIEKYILIGYNL